MHLSTLTIIFLLTFVNSEDDHFFEKKVQEGKKTVIKDGVKEVLTVKKVFVTLFLGGYKFRKKKIFGQRESGNVRALFVCTFCEAKKKTVSFNVNVIVHNVDDQEEDQYVLEQDLVVPVENHWCEPSGIEESVQQFRSQLCQQVRDDPTRAMPALYDETRRIYSQRFSDRDEKSFFCLLFPLFLPCKRFCTIFEENSYHLLRQVKRTLMSILPGFIWMASLLCYQTLFIQTVSEF